MLDFLFALGIFFILFIIAGFFVWNATFYTKTAYYQITKKPYLLIRFGDIGSYGEYLTYKNLKHLEKDGAKFLFNVYLPREDDTTEIDVLLLHKSGIYVFESKNYSGWIFGNEHAKTWTQTLPQGRGRKALKEHFLNPIFQNELHIKCLQNYLSKEVPMHSVVVFSERCELKKLEVQDPRYHVVHRSDSILVVGKISKEVGDILPAEEIAEIYDTLYPCTQVSEQAKQQHIEDLNRRHADTPKPTENEELRCPKCGGELVLREAKKGANKGKTFYGCSNYPKCRYMSPSK